MKFQEIITPSARQAVKYAERLLAGLESVPCAIKPRVGATEISINHPVFTFGHLAIYPQIIAGLTNLPPGETTVSGRYYDLFKIGSPCIEDPEGSVYPGLGEVSGQFFKGMEYIIGQLSSIEESVLSIELEDPGRRERFGTVGAFVAYLLTAHPMTHLGQLSSWRRCMGLPSV